MYIKALAIAEGKRLTEYLKKTGPELAAAWERLVKTASKEVLNRIRASEDYILTSVAEVKALLLGLLERIQRRFDELQDDIQDLSRWLFSAAQTTQEATNIYSRIGVAMGAQVSPDAGQMRVASLMGGVDTFNSVAQALKSDPTPGYTLAFADDSSYRFSKGLGTHVAWRRSGFGANNNHIV